MPGTQQTRTQTAKMPEGGWREGQIAFLKPLDAFSPEDRFNLIDSEYLHKKATGHPVIVLRACETHMVITPVSAYNAKDQKFMPPWKQHWHHGKLKEEYFRAFAGTELPCNSRPPLHLRPGMSMPKPRESWVYVQSVWTVPMRVIGRFNKADEFLEVTPASMADLRAHMNEAGNKWRAADAFFRRITATAASKPAAPLFPARSASSWRAASPASSSSSSSSRPGSPASSTSSSRPVSPAFSASSWRSASPLSSPPSSPPPSPPSSPTKPEPLGVSWAAVVATKSAPRGRQIP